MDNAIPWKKIWFKSSFILGILILEQISLVVSLFVIYKNHLTDISIIHYFYSLPVMIVSSIFLYDYFKLSSFHRKPISNIISDCFKFVVLLFSITCIFAYLFNLYALSRYALVLGSFINYFFLIIWVVIFQKFSQLLYDKVALLIISDCEDDSIEIITKIKCEEKKMNLKIAGWLTPAEIMEKEDLLNGSSEVLISSKVDEKTKFNILLLCSKYNKNVYIVPSFYDLSFSKYKIVKFYDTPSFQIESGELTFQQMLLKRLFDVVFASIVLILTSPLMLIISIIIKLDSKGPVFYAQDRVTLSGKIYKVYKFRTMIDDAEKIFGAYQSLSLDPRVTRIGKFLRNTHLDELPQFVNVLQGTISVVGPRSDRTITIDIMNKKAVGYDYRLKVKSGITGMAQLFGKYNSDPEDKLRYDIYYIKNYSLAFDLQLIMLTIFAMIPRPNKGNIVKTGTDYFISE